MPEETVASPSNPTTKGIPHKIGGPRIEDFTRAMAQENCHVYLITEDQAVLKVKIDGMQENLPKDGTWTIKGVIKGNGYPWDSLIGTRFTIQYTRQSCTGTLILE